MNVTSDTLDSAEVEQLRRENAELRARVGTTDAVKTFDATYLVAAVMAVARELELCGYHVGLAFQRDRNDRITGITMGTGEKR